MEGKPLFERIYQFRPLQLLAAVQYIESCVISYRQELTSTVQPADGTLLDACVFLPALHRILLKSNTVKHTCILPNRLLLRFSARIMMGMLTALTLTEQLIHHSQNSN